VETDLPGVRAVRDQDLSHLCQECDEKRKREVLPQLHERGINWFGKERCRNCGEPTKKSDMRGENCRKCDNEINISKSLPGKDKDGASRD
jgi:hypothetical protein